MAYCPNCGAPVEGKFCAKCGTAVTGAGAGNAAYQQPGYATPSTTGGLTDNVAAALTYIPLIGLIFLLVDPYKTKRFVRFHAFQSLFLLAAEIILSIALGIVLSIILPWWIEWQVMRLFRLAFLLVTIFAAFKAYQNERFKLPVIGDIAEKQA